MYERLCILSNMAQLEGRYGLAKALRRAALDILKEYAK